jgi:hypothetical protein
MTQFKPEWLEHQRKRWMRPDAHAWIRHDAHRFMPPGSPIYVGRDVVKYFWPDPQADERKYSPDQPRVPAGNSDGGQWTNEGGGITDSRVLSDATPDPIRPGAQYAQDNTQRRYSVNLGEEEARGGHTLRDHVGKNDQELLATLRQRRFDFFSFSIIGQRQGAFESIEAANDFVNRTLEQNKSIVDLVASGKLQGQFITARFGYITGREAFRPNPDAEPYLRNTYSVGVLIRHDASTARGYRVITAYPRND